MGTVLLKSRVGPFTARYRPIVDGRYECHVFEWNFDNDFKVAVPEKWWDDFHDKTFDPKNGLRYRDAFLPL